MVYFALLCSSLAGGSVTEQQHQWALCKCQVCQWGWRYQAYWTHSLLNGATVEAFTRRLTGSSRLTKEVVHVIYGLRLRADHFTLPQPLTTTRCEAVVRLYWCLLISTGGFKASSHFLYTSFVSPQIHLSSSCTEAAVICVMFLTSSSLIVAVLFSSVQPPHDQLKHPVLKQHVQVETHWCPNV